MLTKATLRFTPELGNKSQYLPVVGNIYQYEIAHGVFLNVLLKEIVSLKWEHEKAWNLQSDFVPVLKAVCVFEVEESEYERKYKFAQKTFTVDNVTYIKPDKDKDE